MGVVAMGDAEGSVGLMADNCNGVNLILSQADSTDFDL